MRLEYSNFRFIISSIVVLICCLNVSQVTAQQSSIYPLHPFEEIDTINNKVMKYKYFIITNYQYGNKEQLKHIKSYIKEKMDKDYGKFLKYFVVVYKESNDLTRNFRQTESDQLAWHGKDIVYDFEWAKGVFSYCTIYKNGKIVSSVFHE